MAKKGDKKASAARKPADPNKLRMISVHKVLGKANGTKATFRAYGIAKKSVSKDTPFGTAHGLKGNFEVRQDGKVRSAKLIFLGNALQTAVGKVMEANPKEPIMFGVDVERDGDTVKVDFFSDPAVADALTGLREEAAQ